MAFISGILVGLIFVAAVTGLFFVNDIGPEESSHNLTNSEIPEDKIVKALNDFDTELVSFFSELKKDMGI